MFTKFERHGGIVRSRYDQVSHSADFITFSTESSRDLMVGSQVTSRSSHGVQERDKCCNWEFRKQGNEFIGWS